MIAAEKSLLLTVPKGRGHATPWETEMGDKEKHCGRSRGRRKGGTPGQSLYCGFGFAGQGQARQDWDWLV